MIESPSFFWFLFGDEGEVEGEGGFVEAVFFEEGGAAAVGTDAGLGVVEA